MTLMVPVGAVVTAVYFEVPGHYGVGERFDTWVEAAEHAVARRDREAVQFGSDAAKVRCVVDERWTMKWEPKPGYSSSCVDQTMQRTNVDHLDAAHFERLRAMGVTA